MGTRGAYELRQRTAALLERVVVEAAGELADDAARLLDDLRAVWVRERRWRNDGRQLASVEHVAGAVIDCREDRSWCPGYIVDRRQDLRPLRRRSRPRPLVAVLRPRRPGGAAARRYPDLHRTRRHRNTLRRLIRSGAGLWHAVTV